MNPANQPFPQYEFCLNADDREMQGIRYRMLRSFPDLTPLDRAGLLIEWAKSMISRKVLSGPLTEEDEYRFDEAALNSLRFVAPELLVDAGFVPRLNYPSGVTSVHLARRWVAWRNEVDALYLRFTHDNNASLTDREFVIGQWLVDARRHAIAPAEVLLRDVAEGIAIAKSSRQENRTVLDDLYPDIPEPCGVAALISDFSPEARSAIGALCSEARLVRDDFLNRGGDSAFLWADSDGRVRIGKWQVRDSVLRLNKLSRERVQPVVEDLAEDPSEPRDEYATWDWTETLDVLATLHDVQDEMARHYADDQAALDVLPHLRAYLFDELSASEAAHRAGRDRGKTDSILLDAKSRLRRRLG